MNECYVINIDLLRRCQSTSSNENFLRRNIVKVRRKESDLVLYCLVNLISFEIFNTNFLLKFCSKIHAIYVNKRRGPPEQSLDLIKTNENKTVSILDSYYNNIYTNLNLQKKENSLEREHFTEAMSVRKKSQLTIQKEIRFSVF